LIIVGLCYVCCVFGVYFMRVIFGVRLVVMLAGGSVVWFCYLLEFVVYYVMLGFGCLFMFVWVWVFVWMFVLYLFVLFVLFVTFGNSVAFT